MNILTKKTSWSAIELGFIKLTLAAIGILIGSAWPAFWSGQRYVLGLVVIVFGIWSASIWFRELKKR